MPAPIRRIHTKETAEALLNELPNVMGAFVKEDVNGHPREVHLLVTPGPDVRSLAKDVRYLLEQRLGVAVDQRVISIAQLVDIESRDIAPAGPRLAEEPAEHPAGGSVAEDGDERLVLSRTESRLVGGRVEVRVALMWEGVEHEAEASDLDTASGRARAGAGAALAAVTLASGERLSVTLEAASIVGALEREFVLVSALASGKAFGRRPLSVVGAHPAEPDVETGAVLAALKAVNRVATLALSDATGEALRRRPARYRGER